MSKYCFFILFEAWKTEIFRADKHVSASLETRHRSNTVTRHRVLGGDKNIDVDVRRFICRGENHQTAVWVNISPCVRGGWLYFLHKLMNCISTLCHVALCLECFYTRNNRFGRWCPSDGTHLSLPLTLHHWELGASPRYLTFSVCCHFHCRTAEPLMWGHKTLGDDRGGILGQTLSGSMKEDRHLFHIE